MWLRRFTSFQRFMRVRFLWFVRLFGFSVVLTAFVVLWKLGNVSYYSGSKKGSNHSQESDYNGNGFKNECDRSTRDFEGLSSNSIRSIRCIVNEQLTLGCYLLKPQEVLIPFELIRNYFKVYGSLDLSSSTFYLNHADVDIPKPYSHKHNPVGIYMEFHKFNVEKRDNVKLIAADEGVPISQQWDSRGYPYPIQIAQFGLNHFSKLVISSDRAKFEKSENVLSLDNKNMELDLIVPSDNIIHRWTDREFIHKWNDKLILSVGKLNSYGQALSIIPKLQEWDYLIMIGRQWTYGSYIELSLLWYPPVGRSKNYPTKSLVVYNCSSSPIRHQTYATIIHNNKVTYWMPECERQAKMYGFVDSIKVARDLYTDLMKVFYPHRKSSEYAGLSIMKLSNTVNDAKNLSHVQVLKINFYINAQYNNDITIEKLYLGKLTNLRLIFPTVNKIKSAEKLFHEIRFMSAADWFIKHQDKKSGGWSVNVRRSLNGRKALKPGWYSAMGQGQAISLLVRAYNYTRNPLYLEACHRALDLFSVNINHGGIRSYFFNQSDLVWFEEYPFNPPIHILNGFIYSLVGLYDYVKLLVNSPDPLTSSYLSKAQNYLDTGLTSLSKLLPLFDSGSGSFYDLRHLSTDYNNQPVKQSRSAFTRNLFQLSTGPNRARWSYHSLHIKQLQTLIDLDPKRAVQWNTTATRWTAYLQGSRSLQN
ncbi:unnamed protein product [Schistosoma rodhaini]|uniref:Heparosan-N-sulfate-glucuronate 5-epimerase n=2 Tax=Schistosoma mansoni TaxID=6183 RepID=A0A5K4FEL7_SCHMA|nr:unnamed protein product [Schistosoma rodhaini]